MAKYGKGSHGAKKGEQARLTEAFAIDVTGKSHESEHPIGYEPISRGIEEKRGKGGYAREIENSAMAYQEVYESHRAHIGTGNKKSTPMVEAFGLDSDQYRDAQRSLVQSGRVGDAIQLNQMGYAFDEKTSTAWKTKQGLAATDSFNNMLVNQDELKYHGQGKTEVATFSYEEKFEAFVSRKVVANKRYPSADELASYEDEFQSLRAKRLAEEWEGRADPVTGEVYSSGPGKKKKKASAKRSRAEFEDKTDAASPFTLGETNEEKPRKRARRKATKSAAGDGSGSVKSDPTPAVPKARRRGRPRKNAPASGDGAFKLSSPAPGADPASEAFSLKPPPPPSAKPPPSPFAMDEEVPSETPSVTEGTEFVPMEE